MEENKVQITVNGIDVTKITCSEMSEVLENSGYLESTFDKVEYLEIEKNQVVFKYLNSDDDGWYVGYIFVTMDGNSDFCGNAERFGEDLNNEEDEQKAIEYFNNLK